MCFLFFFKQKTAYELRISDWSSDVCSSDLCTYGIACRAVIEGFAGWDPERLASLAARFSAPVFPGDALVIDLWRDGDIISFEAQVPDRGVTVLKNGRAELRGT